MAKADIRADEHAAVWAVIDQTAARLGVSPSGLAKKAGRDAAAFNKSKRVAADGSRRWPSLETVARVLAIAGMAYGDFGRLVDMQIKHQSEKD